MFTRIITPESDIFCHLLPDVDNIVKLLKTNVFILEKFLDTAFRGPIRFRQKVLMVFFRLRWNYSPLKEKAVQLPDGLFVCFCREAALRSTPLERAASAESVNAPEATGSPRGRASPQFLSLRSSPLESRCDPN